MFLRSINVFLVTGFLGSGKTTFLSQLLDQVNSFPHLKCGVLINEYGLENVDLGLLPLEGITFSEINGGSIFCSCLHGEFIHALKEFYESTKVNTLFIETSGLSNPSMIFQDLKVVKKQIGDVYKIKESICIVDASLFLKLINAMTSISTQIEVSSLILINKTDLVDSKELESVEKAIRAINPNTSISMTKFGVFNLKNLIKPQKVLLQSGLESRRDKRGEFSSITLNQKSSFSKAEFIEYVKSLDDSILRMKGYVNLGIEGWYRVDKIHSDLQLKHIPFHPDEGTLVLIFRENIDQKQLKSQWALLGSLNNE